MAILMVQPIPDRFRAACAFCGEDLDVRDHGIYQYTRGWVKSRLGGGGNAVSLPERDPKWAHPLCVERVSNGTFGQATMFDRR